jgi:hypothetical protein
LGFSNVNSPRIATIAALAAAGLAYACAPPEPAAHASGVEDGATGEVPEGDDTSASASGSDGDREPSDRQPGESSEGTGRSAGAATESPAPSIDLDAWARERGVVVDLKVERCEAAGLGDKPGDTLWCYRQEEQPGARLVYLRSLYALAGKRFVRVTELLYATGPFAAEGQATAPKTVELAARVASDGQSVTFEEMPGRTCDDGHAANDKALIDEPLGGPDFAKLVDRVCAVRGRYTWRAGALKKDR